MRFIFIVSGSENLDASGPPPAALIEEIGRLTEEEARKGRLLSFGGLFPTSSGARIRSANGELVTRDGPFTESKEVVGGFSIFDFASREEAIAEGHKFMELHRLHWPTWEGQVEIRQLFEAEDDVREVQIEGSRVLAQADARR